MRRAFTAKSQCFLPVLGAIASDNYILYVNWSDLRRLDSDIREIELRYAFHMSVVGAGGFHNT
jgi:hypothetical protein